MDFSSALARQISSHPLLKSEDFLKLAYQAAYGSEHLVASPDSAQAFFDEEYQKVKEASLPLYEDIGNGSVRVNLASWKQEKLPSQDLFSLFLKSASAQAAGDCLFPKYLAHIGKLASLSQAPLSLKEWEGAVALYQKMGGGPLHHSGAYTHAYDPHYRVVRKSLLKRYLASIKGKPARKKSPVLTTKRLILRPFEERDLDPLHAWCSSANVTKWLQWWPHRNKDVTSRLLKKWIKTKRNYAWALDMNGEAIGEIEVIKDLPKGGFEVGYLLAEKAWREGLMSEGLSKALRYLFDEGGYRFADAEVDERNLPSLRLLQKLGFKAFSQKKAFVGKKGSETSLICLRLEKSDFRF